MGSKPLSIQLSNLQGSRNDVAAQALCAKRHPPVPVCLVAHLKPPFVAILFFHAGISRTLTPFFRTSLCEANSTASIPCGFNSLQRWVLRASIVILDSQAA
jgi:hypothetical protein